MGRLLQASCSECGYESGMLRVEAGRRTVKTYFGVPARCDQEHAVVVVNLRALHPHPAEEADEAEEHKHEKPPHINTLGRGPLAELKHLLQELIPGGEDGDDAPKAEANAALVSEEPAPEEPPKRKTRRKKPAIRGISATEQPVTPAPTTDTRAVPAAKSNNLGLVATPVPPRSKPAPTSANHALVPVASDVAEIAYPCPNDGAATVLYEIQPEDLDTPQQCPNCGKLGLTFRVTGRWD